MRKKLSVFSFLAALFALLLCGCSDNVKTTKTTLPTLIIGSDFYSPYVYVDDNGGYAGIDVEIAEEACRRMGVKPVFKQIAWQDKDAFLSSGSVDCLWGSFSMNGRENDYAWAGPYMRSKQVVVVNESSDMYRLGDLNGKSVAVQNSSKPEKIFLNDELSGVSVKRVYSFSDISTVFAALKKGYADAAAGHETACRDYVKNISGDYRILDGVLLASRLGVAFNKETGQQTADKLSGVLKEMKEHGAIKSILEKYDLDIDFALGEDDMQ